MNLLEVQAHHSLGPDYNIYLTQETQRMDSRKSF
jgi:hypothetical protein